MTDEQSIRPPQKPCPCAWGSIACGGCDTCIDNMPSTLLLKRGGPVPTKEELFQDLRNRSLSDPLLYHVMSLCRRDGLGEAHMGYLLACAEAEQFRQLRKRVLDDLVLKPPMQIPRSDG